MKSLYAIPESEFRQEDSVDKAADKTPTMNKPGRPGIKRATSRTKYGNIWSYFPTSPWKTGSQSL